MVIEAENTIRGNLPEWLRRPVAESVSRGTARNAVNGLHTVCEEARCPNRGVCLGEQHTATFLIMGPGCSRNCRFCSVGETITELDATEPYRVAEAVDRLDLDYVVITSTTRDDLGDGGAVHIARTVSAIRKTRPNARLEVLAPDFGGDSGAVDIVTAAGIVVFGHNIEMVPRFYTALRPGADYNRSLSVLKRAAETGVAVKTALILGFGETEGEIIGSLEDLREVGVSLLAIGQYLRPGKEQVPVVRYIEPEEFEKWRVYAVENGFIACASGPFVRSSFNAADMYKQYITARVENAL